MWNNSEYFLAEYFKKQQTNKKPIRSTAIVINSLLIHLVSYAAFARRQKDTTAGTQALVLCALPTDAMVRSHTRTGLQNIIPFRHTHNKHTHFQMEKIRGFYSNLNKEHNNPMMGRESLKLEMYLTSTGVTQWGNTRLLQGT